jgi:ABC-2 type transport system permease protein
MNGFISVFKREFKSYFATPVAYVFLVIFVFFAGYLPFRQGFFEARNADLRLFFNNLPLLFIFLVPCTAMRLWSEERKSGSIELLLTLPITPLQAVLGKFFAAWTFLTIAMTLTITMPITAAYLGNPDVGLIVTGYLGAILMAGGFLAVGNFFSAVSKNQVISFILSVAVLAVLVYAAMPTTINYLGGFLPTQIVKAIASMSFLQHFESIQRGIVQFKDIAYFVVLIVGWLAASVVILNERKAS